MTDEELREQLSDYALINETPVGTKMYPEDAVITLGSLLSPKDIDNLMQLIKARDAAKELEAKIEYAEYTVTNRPTHAWHTHKLSIFREQLELERRESDQAKEGN